MGHHTKGPISSFISHFLKNKKHTNFNRCLHLYANQKLNKKSPNEGAYTSRSCHISQHRAKSRHCAKMPRGRLSTLSYTIPWRSISSPESRVFILVALARVNASNWFN